MHLNKFNTISLTDLDKVSLLNRKDSKFIFHYNKLPILLKELRNKYKILEIDNKRLFNYYNIYYDTNNLLFYNAHHNGKRKRFKIRIRRYLDSDLLFFEIKIKNNKNKTIKKRIEITTEKQIYSEEIKQFIKKNLGPISYKLLPNKLLPKLFIEFSRITLVDNNFTERLTIDTNLKIKNDTITKKFDGLVISEIKQAKYNPKSDFIKILRLLKIHEMKFSKYCISMVNLHNDIKYNIFKEKKIFINKLLKDF